MKKTALILALAFATTFTTVQANENTSLENYETLTVAPAKVNTFCMAIAKGDTETVKKLIELGEDVNRKSNGMTPAMYAARYNRVAILELLIKHGADLTKKNDKGFTAKKYAELSNAKDALAVIKNALAK